MVKQIGDKTQFTFSTKTYLLAEIINNPGISMWWTWKSEICPHCKKEITKRNLYTFNQIDIYIPEGLDATKVAIEDLVILGATSEGRLLTVTIDKFNEIFSKSKKFNYLQGNKDNG